MIRLNRQVEVRMKNLPAAAKIVLGCSLLIAFLTYGGIAYSLFRNHMGDPGFTGQDKCPACYGTSYCKKFKNGIVRLQGWSRSRWLDFVNVRNVHFASSGYDIVVLKKLANNNELEDVDAQICKLAHMGSDCDITKAIEKTEALKDFRLETHELKHISRNFKCVSPRLLTLMMSSYREMRDPNAMSLREMSYFLTTFMINPEPLIIQTFPASEGWPFPYYLGACGRFVVEEYGGQTFTELYNAPWEERVDYSYQVLKIAEKFTENESGYSIYWMDIHPGDFSVNSEGKVIVIDAEDLLIVDKSKVKRDKKPGWDKFLEQGYDKCEDGLQDCFEFNSEQLCNVMDTDHNYYMVCRGLLSPYANYPGQPGGLLHGLPSVVTDKNQLNYLLEECAKPSAGSNRIKVKDKLVEILYKLKVEYF